MPLINRIFQLSRDRLLRSLTCNQSRCTSSIIQTNPHWFSPHSSLQSCTLLTNKHAHVNVHTHGHHHQLFSTSSTAPSPSKQKKQRGFIPRKAALNLKPKARQFLTLLLADSPPDIIGIVLKYQPATDGMSMRMVFSLDFVREGFVGEEDEGVSLEILEDGSPKLPSDSDGDGLKKVYIHHTAFMKVLGATMDIDVEDDGSFSPTFTDREGNDLDPNDI